jgi:hypothetical protein
MRAAEVAASNAPKVGPTIRALCVSAASRNEQHQPGHNRRSGGQRSNGERLSLLRLHLDWTQFGDGALARKGDSSQCETDYAENDQDDTEDSHAMPEQGFEDREAEGDERRERKLSRVSGLAKKGA